MPGRRSVWVVDDSPLDALRTRDVLSPAYDIEVFSDGSSALECLAREKREPDLMVLDWMMPGVSGVDVCRFLRADGDGHPMMSLLMLTAHRAKEQIVEGLAAGANDFLAKPFDDQELLARVGALVRSRELRERAEHAEALNKTILLSTPDPLLVVDDNRCVSFANVVAEALWQAAPGGLIGRPLAELLPTLDTAATTWADIDLCDQVFSPTVRTFERASGVPTTISLRDVTDRRRAELRRLDFYAIIAHDLRSPLTAITLRTDQMLRGRHGVLPPRTVSDIRKIDENLKSLVALINDFLDLGSLEGAAPTMRKEPVPLASVIDKVMEDFRPLLEANQIEWRAGEQHRPDAVVQGDARRLTQVVKNLIGNAVKFTPPQGVITTAVAVSNADVLVTIEDTGRGIAAADLPQLFKRYSRIDVGEVAGSGLGLMIVREIIEAHGGMVGVDSETGRGSRFWFRIPGGSAPLAVQAR